MYQVGFGRLNPICLGRHGIESFANFSYLIYTLPNLLECGCLFHSIIHVSLLKPHA